MYQLRQMKKHRRRYRFEQYSTHNRVHINTKKRTLLKQG